MARLRLQASDPDGDPLTYAIAPLPAGATFDPSEGLFSWRPLSAQQVQLSFRVSDGRLVDTLNLTVTVRGNAAPRADQYERTLVFEAGASERRPEGIELAQDPDGDDVAVRVAKAPRGARLVAVASRVILNFAPDATEAGEYPLEFEVTDGEHSTRASHTVLVVPKWNRSDWGGSLLPGGGPSAFVMHGSGDAYVGGAFDVTVRAIREDGPTGRHCARDEEAGSMCHASHRRFYAEFEVLDALRASVPSLFSYGLGFSSTFEYYPARHALIPFYLAEVGGLVQNGPGHLAQTRAALGLHLWASDAVWISAALGYRVVPAGLYERSGPTSTLRVMLNPW
jgi:hypothetical protein